MTLHILADAAEDEARRISERVIRDIVVSGVKTLAGIARTLQARGVKTPAGRTEWQAVQVVRRLTA